MSTPLAFIIHRYNTVVKSYQSLQDNYKDVSEFEQRQKDYHAQDDAIKLSIESLLQDIRSRAIADVNEADPLIKAINDKANAKDKDNG